jgi:hypothetical protein
LEGEVADPSNPALKAEGVDAGEMIRGLVDVRRRLEKVRMGREGRGRLVGVVLGDGGREDGEEDVKQPSADDKARESKVQGLPEVRGVAEMDKRVGELEKLVGSVGATLDEVCDFRGRGVGYCANPFSVHADYSASSSYAHAFEFATDAFDSTAAYRFYLPSIETSVVRP